MEISKAGKNSIKIKTRTVTIIIDPEDVIQSEVVMFMSPHYQYSAGESNKLVIQGPGEYELGGVYIKGERIGEDVLYTISDQYTIVVLPSTLSQKIKDQDGTDAVIMKVDTKIDKNLFSVSGSDTLIIYGDTEIPESSEIKKMSKVNLKKKEEITGFVIYLG